MGYEGTVGTLKPGANADVSVFELRDENFDLRDCDGNVVTTRRHLVTHMTVKDGRVWYERKMAD
jgi:predicted amidohydrolase